MHETYSKEKKSHTPDRLDRSRVAPFSINVNVQSHAT